MAARSKKELTLKEAAAFAWEHGIVEPDGFHHLDDDEKTSLVALVKRTKWRQSTASKRAGHSITYAFHSALVRQLPKRNVQYASTEWRRAENAENHATDEDTHFYPEDASQAKFNRVINAFMIAADAWEEIGYQRRALALRKKARRYQETEKERFGTARDTLRRMRRRRISKHKHRRSRRDASAATRKKQAFISKKIRLLRAEGYPQRQAVAIAMRYAGVPRPARMRTKHLSSSERRTSLRAKHRKGGSWWKRHHKRGR